MSKGLDIVYLLAGAIGLVVAIWQIYLFIQSPGTSTNSHLWFAILGAVVALACGVGYFMRHVNKEEEIHITE
ncbi:MAG TPA: hypothetical protein VK421_21180 [Pyrinomonadaceae bacterium]|nr:hypothetical protein [Pyrinomonadaceae bacterium]